MEKRRFSLDLTKSTEFNRWMREYCSVVVLVQPCRKTTGRKIKIKTTRAEYRALILKTLFTRKIKLYILKTAFDLPLREDKDKFYCSERVSIN